jgi:hypothetical protein
MKHKTLFRTHDYREACEKFTKFKEHGTAYITYDYPTNEYIVELVREVKSSTDLMRQILVDIKLNHDLIEEEIDALNFADSAIKTLQDMEIIK